MGSWNETCGFSNLPITVGEPVYFAVIRKTPSDRRPIFYSFDLYQPVTPLIPGSYDDYGGCDMEKADEKQLFRFVARRKQIGREGPEMTVNGTDYALPTDHWPWMMRQDAYQMMLSMSLRDSEGTVREYERDMRERFSDKIKEDRRKWGKFGSAFASFSTYELKRMFDGREAKTPPVYEKVLDGLQEALETPGKEYISIAACERLVEPLWPVANLYLALDLVRKILAPTNGSSQSWNFPAYKVLGDFITEKAREQGREWEGYDD